jgi:hypothetical protein
VPSLFLTSASINFMASDRAGGAGCLMLPQTRAALNVGEQERQGSGGKRRLCARVVHAAPSYYTKEACTTASL